MQHVSFSTSCLGSDVASFNPSFLIFILKSVLPVQGINKWNKFLAIVLCIFLFCITTDTASSGMHAHTAKRRKVSDVPGICLTSYAYIPHIYLLDVQMGT